MSSKNYTRPPIRPKIFNAKCLHKMSHRHTVPSLNAPRTARCPCNTTQQRSRKTISGRNKRECRLRWSRELRVVRCGYRKWKAYFRSKWGFEERTLRLWRMLHEEQFGRKLQTPVWLPMRQLYESRDNALHISINTTEIGRFSRQLPLNKAKRFLNSILQ